jgi:hypothetical protein
LRTLHGFGALRDYVSCREFSTPPAHLPEGQADRESLNIEGKDTINRMGLSPQIPLRENSNPPFAPTCPKAGTTCLSSEVPGSPPRYKTSGHEICLLHWTAACTQKLHFMKLGSLPHFGGSTFNSSIPHQVSEIVRRNPVCDSVRRL